MNWQTVFNPFSKFSEKQLFIFGFLFFILDVLVCFYTSTRMDSIFHFSPQENLTLSGAFVFVSISTASAILFLFLVALLINKKTRFINIVNTVLLSQAPNFLVLLSIKYSGLETLANNLKTTDGSPPSIDLNTIAIIPFVVGICLMLVLIVYGFILIYNGFKTATNLKKGLHITLFVISLFLFTLFHQIYLQRLIV
jgi:predicted membrane channel-forming protein YqfA (hemolysin III family)